MVMGSMPMPGGWTMSMAWVRLSDETWAAAVISFLVMWVVMMAAMMLPSVTPTLWRSRYAITGDRRIVATCRTAALGLGYLLVWGVLGLVIFFVGAVLATLEMHHGSLARAVPIADGITVLAGGAFQFTRPKVHQLACCRRVPERSRRSSTSAWRDGVHLGVHCSYCSAGLTAILLALGIMDPRAMAAVTVAITLERLAPAGQRVAQGIGVVAVGGGLVLIAHAFGVS
ncbi:MAG TPA: DUF2182 domain-containing protein [Vicinamibacterales bacterium]|jgi:predicted metal-binding membrane protein